MVILKNEPCIIIFNLRFRISCIFRNVFQYFFAKYWSFIEKLHMWYFHLLSNSGKNVCMRSNLQTYWYVCISFYNFEAFLKQTCDWRCSGNRNDKNNVFILNALKKRFCIYWVYTLLLLLCLRFALLLYIWGLEK